MGGKSFSFRLPSSMGHIPEPVPTSRIFFGLWGEAKSSRPRLTNLSMWCCMSIRSSSCSSLGYKYAGGLKEIQSETRLAPRVSKRPAHTALMIFVVSSSIFHGVIRYTGSQRLRVTIVTFSTNTTNRSEDASNQAVLAPLAQFSEYSWKSQYLLFTTRSLRHGVLVITRGDGSKETM